MLIGEMWGLGQSSRIMNQINQASFHSEARPLKSQAAAFPSHGILQSALPVGALALGGILTLVWAGFLVWGAGRMLTLW